MYSPDSLLILPYEFAYSVVVCMCMYIRYSQVLYWNMSIIVRWRTVYIHALLQHGRVAPLADETLDSLAQKVQTPSPLESCERRSLDGFLIFPRRCINALRELALRENQRALGCIQPVCSRPPDLFLALPPPLISRHAFW